ncbi:MAG: AMP-binding protein [Acidobacteria bacterium]|nr:AMP-binding protein [Acidobacteriota bacterium]
MDECTAYDSRKACGTKTGFSLCRADVLPATFPAVINVTMNGGAHALLQKFDLKELIEIIERDKVTSIVLVPTMINFLIHHPDLNNHDLSSLRRITYGASPMPVELLKKSMAAFPGCEFIQGYGQTESSPLLTTLMPEDHVTEGPASVIRRLASCGRPILGVEVEVVNEAGIPVKIGEVGEVVARGPNVMMGYWKRPEETRETLRGGWLHTGDLAIVDEAGYIYLVDRKKDMIISGGENVFSTEVENVIYTHPAIREAAVIGIPDEKWGEAVSVIVTLKPGSTLSDKDLHRLLRRKTCRLQSAKIRRDSRWRTPRAAPARYSRKNCASHTGRANQDISINAWETYREVCPPEGQ